MPRKKTGEGNIFLQEKPTRVLNLLESEEKPVYQTKVSKKVDSTYAHTLKILKIMNEMKLVDFEESGRIKLVKLTKIGGEAANALKMFSQVLELGEIEGKIEQIYVKEVKGKLRGDMDKEAISKQYGRIKEKLEDYFEGYPQNICILARKLSKKVDTILAEALGYPPEPYMSHQE